MNLSYIVCILSLLISLTNGFYVPGIAPREFTKGSRIGKAFLLNLMMWWQTQCLEFIVFVISLK